MQQKRLIVLRVLLAVAVVESFVHYLDNTVHWSDYVGTHPPTLTSWIARWMIPVSWIAFTAAGAIGYRRFRQQRWPQAAAWLGAYSGSGIVSLAHYLGISLSDLTPAQNVLVFADIALGFAILAFATWTALDSPPPTPAPA